MCVSLFEFHIFYNTVNAVFIYGLYCPIYKLCQCIILITGSYEYIWSAIRGTALTYKVVWMHAKVEMFIWPLAYTTPTTFRAAGDARFPMVIVILSMIFSRIALSYVYPAYNLQTSEIYLS